MKDLVTQFYMGMLPLSYVPIYYPKLSHFLIVEDNSGTSSYSL